MPDDQWGPIWSVMGLGGEAVRDPLHRAVRESRHGVRLVAGQGQVDRQCGDQKVNSQKDQVWP
ncbi:hypothetical protein GCM10010207_45350 [Streptomyces atratus]|nr:hypothetical protein GCM10010207_45350 [Streptomyces atratus]